MEASFRRTIYCVVVSIFRSKHALKMRILLGEVQVNIARLTQVPKYQSLESYSMSHWKGITSSSDPIASRCLLTFSYPPTYLLR